MSGIEIHRSVSELIAPATEPVTTAEAKSWMNVDTSVDDTMIDAMIAAARLQAEVFTGRAFVARMVRATWDDFPGGRKDTLSSARSRGVLLLPKPPLFYLKRIRYTNTSGTVTALGDVAMDVRVVTATPETLDVFNILVAGVNVATFTCGATETAAAVHIGLAAAWNVSTSGLTDYVTAISSASDVQLLADSVGEGFAVTVSATDGGGADTQSITAAAQNDESTVYTVDATSEPARIEPVPSQSWPDTQDVLNAVQVDFVAGYGAASAVPENAKSAIKMMVADMYEHRESQIEIKIEENMAVRNLLWGLRVLNVY